MAATPATVFVVFTSLLFLLHGKPTVGGASEDDDRSALLAFKSAVSGDPNAALAGWGASADACNWTGVACDKVAWRVVRLELIDQQLSGEVSPALGNLSRLRVLNLSGNLFAGSVPPELGNLSRLRVLNLSTNLFAGGVPPELGNLSRLKVLDLSSNTLLSGTVPPELGNLSRLSSLDLSGNAFAGPVPLLLGKLSGLTLLNLAGNGFQGSIPLELTRVQSLEYLNLAENNLSGHIPAAIFCNLSAMHYIDLSSNNLDGAIPIGPDCFLPNLTFLVLWSNNLVGGIPRSLSNATKLRWLLLEKNLLDGELPSDGTFSGMSNLEILDLSSNNFRSPRNNTDLEPFFASLTNCTALRELDVAGNDLAGTIPPSVSRLSPGLAELHLEFNRLFGPIPTNLSDLANLTTLNLSHNLLNGSIPPDLSRMQRLERLHLSDNLLSGSIPPSLGAIHRLGLVDFSQNRLTGAIPDTVTDLKQLRELTLHHNQLAGAIRPSIGQCVNLLKLDLSHNMLEGKIPAGLSELSGLNYLKLSGNQLSGAIPSTIGEMRMLQVLNLSSNRLSGKIPLELGNCVALEDLDVSANALTGELPSSLGKMASLRRFNFSYNGFSGEVPSGGAFARFPADAFLGNAGLCVGTASMAPGLARCGSTKRRVLHKRRRRVVLPVAVTVASFTVAIIWLGACRAVARTASVGRDGQPSTLIAYGGGELSERGNHPRISHRELFEATGGFEQSGLIGAGRFGRVYEGTLRDGTRVAVKVLDPKTGGGEVSRSFKRECDVLRRTRHRNLVRVVTTCSQPDFHALVLPLMTNGSLENSLYPRDGGPSRGIDLARMVAIAGDIAEGLAYLHHYAPVRVVHCDLKPSNVLLDGDMTAVVADFGIARLVKGADNDHDYSTGSADPCNSITGLLQGSVGYIPPEYGLGGRPSTEGDVYSFGVMLLELITGKRPTDVLFQEGLTLHDWVRRQRHHPHDITAVVEHSWLAEAMFSAVPADDIMVQLIDLGIACTQHSQLLRPTMVEVCHEIALLKEDLGKHRGVAASVVMTTGEGSCSTTDSSF